MKIIRAVTGIVAGLIVWFLVATAGNRLLRVSWPGNAGTAKPLKFTLGMMGSAACVGRVVFRLRWIYGCLGHEEQRNGRKGTRHNVDAVFIPVHYGLWDKFPIWYHLTFLVSLLPLTLMGATLQAQPDVER